MSQERAADVLGVDRSTVARWERGDTAPQAWHRPRLAEALKLSPEALEALLADMIGEREPQLPGADPPACIESFPVAGAEELRERLLNTAAVDERMFSLLAAQVDHIREVDRCLGARPALAMMDGYLAALEQLRAFGVSPRQREPLARLYADAATLTGWQCVDLGKLDRAWRLYEVAKDAAREGSPAVLVHAMAEQAYVLAEVGEFASALQLAQYARTVAGTAVPPLMLSWLAAVQGELYAALGDGAHCRRAFETAESLLPTEPTDPQLPYIVLSDVHLARWRGNARATLGDVAATDDLCHAASGMEASFTRARAGLHVDLAGALAAARQYDEAEAELKVATDLATRVGSARQRSRARQLESVLQAS